MRGLLGMVVLLVVAELALRSFIVVGRSAVPGMVANSLDGNAPLTSDAWGHRFLRNHAEGRGLVEQPLYRVHPTRGWTTKLDEHPPIADVDAALRMLDRMPAVRLRSSRLVGLFLAAHDTVRVVPANWRRAQVVTTELVRGMRDRCRAANVPFVFALIGNFRGAANPDDANDPGERAFRETCTALAGPGFSCPDWRDVRVRTGLSWQGHYKRLGNEMIAELVQHGLAPYVKVPAGTP